MTNELFNAMINSLEEQRQTILEGEKVKEISILITFKGDEVPSIVINKEVFIHNEDGEVLLTGGRANGNN